MNRLTVLLVLLLSGCGHGTPGPPTATITPLANGKQFNPSDVLKGPIILTCQVTVNRRSDVSTMVDGIERNLARGYEITDGRHTLKVVVKGKGVFHSETYPFTVIPSLPYHDPLLGAWYVEPTFEVLTDDGHHVVTAVVEDPQQDLTGAQWALNSSVSWGADCSSPVDIQYGDHAWILKFRIPKTSFPELPEGISLAGTLHGELILSLS